MTQELLRQLASGGLRALPPERLDDLAQWCLEWAEATGDGRYSVLAQTLTQLRSWFGGDEGRDIDGRSVSRAMASKYVRTAARRSELEGHAWHDLRHHHASILLSAGVSPALVAERLGHDVKTLLTTYAHVIRNDDERVRAIVDESLGVSTEDWLRTEAIS